jgi:hypothetical protein
LRSIDVGFFSHLGESNVEGKSREAGRDALWDFTNSEGIPVLVILFDGIYFPPEERVRSPNLLSVPDEAEQRLRN